MSMLETYREHVAERAALGIVPQPLDAQQTADLVELLKAPPKGEEDFLMNLLTQRVPAGVDDAAYVKAGFLSAVSKGEIKCPLIDNVHAIELLGTMLGGFNILPLVSIGANAIHVPFHTTWQHELIDNKALSNKEYTTVDHIFDVLKLVEK